MENTENKEMETVKQKPKRKHLLAEIAQLKELNKKLENDLEYEGVIQGVLSRKKK